MNRIFVLVKLSIILSLLDALFILISSDAAFIYIVYFILGISCVFILLTKKGRLQVNLLFKIFIIRVIFEPVMNYYRYDSLAIGFVTLLIGLAILVFLKHFETIVDYV